MGGKSSPSASKPPGSFLHPTMKIAVDAMGGDNAPQDVVDGVLQSVRARQSEVILVGDQDRVRAALHQSANGARFDTISVHHATQIISMGESPTSAVKLKKDSSMVVSARLVRDQEAAAMVSVGNTGACMAAALLVLGRLAGVQRPAVAIPIPHVHGLSTVIDAGANVDCRPSHLAQFAVMGEVYSEQILGVSHPRVGLLNVGEEEGKGGEAVQEAYALLRRSRVNFIGNVEGRDIVNGRVDVIVCDGFVGNIVLKFAEGMAAGVVDMLKEEYRRSGPLAKLGAVLSRPAFRKLKHRIDPATYGGAPLLGVNGTCVVGHGASTPHAISNAIALAERMIELKVNSQIIERLQSLPLPRGGQA